MCLKQLHTIAGGGAGGGGEREWKQNKKQKKQLAKNKNQVDDDDVVIQLTILIKTESAINFSLFFFPSSVVIVGCLSLFFITAAHYNSQHEFEIFILVVKCHSSFNGQT